LLIPDRSHRATTLQVGRAGAIAGRDRLARAVSHDWARAL